MEELFPGSFAENCECDSFQQLWREEDNNNESKLDADAFEGSQDLMSKSQLLKLHSRFEVGFKFPKAEALLSLHKKKWKLLFESRQTIVDQKKSKFLRNDEEGASFVCKYKRSLMVSGYLAFWSDITTEYVISQCDSGAAALW